MRKFLIFFLIVLNLLLAAFDVNAATPSPEVTPEASQEEAVMGEKVKEIRDAIKEKVREKIEEAKRGPKRAFVGEISQIADNTLKLENRQGNREVQIDTEAAIIGLKRETLQFEDLQPDDFVIAMGYLSEENVLLARRIVLRPKPKPRQREVAFGLVTDISAAEGEEILTVKNEKKGMTYMVDAGSAKMITKKLEGKIQKVTFADIALDDRLVAIGTVTENEEKIITAKIIHVIPGQPSESEGQPTPELTPAESLAVTPTESPAIPSPTEEE